MPSRVALSFSSRAVPPPDFPDPSAPSCALLLTERLVESHKQQASLAEDLTRTRAAAQGYIEQVRHSQGPSVKQHGSEWRQENEAFTHESPTHPPLLSPSPPRRYPRSLCAARSQLREAGARLARANAENADLRRHLEAAQDALQARESAFFLVVFA